MVQPSSEIRQHAVQAAGVLGTNVVRLPQVALPLGRLLGEDVALVGVAALVLAGSGLPEALGRRPIGLDLGHCDVLSEVGHWPGRWLRHAFRPALAGLSAARSGGSATGPARRARRSRRTGPHIMRG